MTLLAIIILAAAFFAGTYLADVVHDRNAWRRADARARDVMRRQRL